MVAFVALDTQSGNMDPCSVPGAHEPEAPEGCVERGCFLQFTVLFAVLAKKQMKGENKL